MVTKWEYMVSIAQDTRPGHLNEDGMEGWELVAVVPVTPYRWLGTEPESLYYFKRELEREPVDEQSMPLPLPPPPPPPPPPSRVTPSTKTARRGKGSGT